jgi:F0F1-type ATP synthase membrane subunit b/b'
MSIKQDRVAPRTAEDIERKYNFGKKFSEILGLIDESRKQVDAVESGLKNEIKKTATDIKRDTEQIVATATKDIRTELGNEISEVSKKVELKVDANAVNIAIEQRMSEGVDQVETKTGYRFDAEGLKISKAGEEMANKLDNTGMYVTRSGEDILVANNNGVGATNLHAKTYLIIGSGNGRSRIEDYGATRTGVFWIG